MYTVPLQKLAPGMITAERVVTKQGQLIVDKNQMLTKQMITHMAFYNVTDVKILDGALPPEVIQSMAQEKEAHDTYSRRVKSSQEFKEFQIHYEENISELDHSINDFITKNIPFNKETLVDLTLDLFSKNATTISMFDMLHNSRQINDSTYAHSINVAIISRMIGMWMNYDEEALDTLTLGGLLHDIGKCKIPAEILNKPGRLTAEEYAIIKTHPTLGYEMIKNQSISTRVKRIVLSHHERCDGTGYPMGLSGEDIDDYANIIGIADIYDAMTANRCYRDGVCPFEVISIFESDGLGQFKPQFITIFLERIANTYIGNNVLLSNGSIGKIVLINKGKLTRPVVQTSDNRFIDLDKNPDVYIQAII